MFKIGLMVLVILFSNPVIYGHTGNIYAFFSNITISEKINGNIYAVYSDIRIENTEIVGEIISLSSKIYVFDDEKPAIRQLLPVFSLFSREEVNSSYVLYDDSIPFVVFQTIFFFFNLFIFYTLLSIKRSVLEQASLTLKHEPKSVIVKGILTYFVFVCVALTFFISIIGIPITIIFILVCFLLVFSGQAVLSIAVGSLITKKLDMFFGKVNIYKDIFVGATFIFLLKIIPYLNLFIYFIVLPIICLGMIVACFVNGFLKKTFYTSEYSFSKKELFNKSDMRNIILKE